MTSTLRLLRKPPVMNHGLELLTLMLRFSNMKMGLLPAMAANLHISENLYGKLWSIVNAYFPRVDFGEILIIFLKSHGGMFKVVLFHYVTLKALSWFHQDPYSGDLTAQTAFRGLRKGF